MNKHMGIDVEHFKESIAFHKDEYSDKMLFKDYQDLILSYNAEAAGLSRMGLVGYIADFRAHLTELLLIEPVKLLFVCGFTTLDGILKFIKMKSHEEGKTLWNDAGHEGRHWLRELLHEKKMFIETLIENFKEFTEEI